MEKEFEAGRGKAGGPSGGYSGLGREELWEELRERDSLIRELVEGRLEEERLRPVESSILVDPGYIFEDGRFWAVRLADEIVGQLPEGFLVTPVTRRGGDVIWRYDEGRGVFRPDGIPWVYTRVKGILGDENASSRMSETVKQIMVETYDFGDSLRREQSLNIVVVENGALDIFTGELHPFSPLYRAKNRLPVRYDPGAECPEFRRFLGEVHHQEDLPFIQEWWGYHLFREYRYHKAVMFMGEGMNGKSTELNALQRFLGEENTSNETLYSLVVNRFSPGNLYGRLANIAPDLAPDEIRRTGPFKALTGNDRIRGEHKFEQPFQFKNHAKLSFSCNQMPTTPDNTQAFFRRWEIINFPNTFSEGDPDKLERITTPEELSGILNWALEGLHRLLENKGFTRTRSTEEIASEWREKSNPVRSFHENCLRKDPDGVTPKDVMYHAYSSYCRARGFTKEIKQQLTVKLKEVEPLLKEGRRTLPGYEKRTTCWLGTTLRCKQNQDDGEATPYCHGCQGCQGHHYFNPRGKGLEEYTEHTEPEENTGLPSKINDIHDLTDNQQIKEAGDIIVELLRKHGDEMETGRLYLLLEEAGVDARKAHTAIASDPRITIEGTKTALSEHDEQESTPFTTTPGLVNESKPEPGSVSRNLRLTLEVIKKLERQGETALKEGIYGTLRERYGISFEEAEKLITVLKRDGVIYEPRPGCYKTDNGGL